MKQRIYVVVAFLAMSFIVLRNSGVLFGPGAAPDPPKQVNIASPRSFSFRDYTITPLATFHIKAKVLSRKDYRQDRESDISPVDLALGWGRMSNEKVLDSIDISQSNRWYKWWADRLPIPKREIETHSGNMHLVPANQSVGSVMNRTRKGDIVEFSGSLIRIDAKKGDWHWVSSLSRTDTGSHACEVVWVESFEIQEL
ncbi:MAG: hypothetical protein QGH60_01065 [Phycisphaerae bacterium]|jgi:hypothetical protein|nr:hypothetical protein [Phycisphaerae bacterium]